MQPQVSGQVQLPRSILTPIGRLPLFWRVQIVGWSVYAVATLPLKIVLYESVGYALLVTLFRESFGLLLTSAFRAFYRWRGVRMDQPLQLIGWVLSIGFAASAVDSLLGRGIEQLAGRTVSADPRFGIFCFRALLFTVWSLLYLGVKSLIDARERLLALSRAETAARDAEIRMLRAQVSPHFLFNAFNTILADLDGRNPGLVPVVRGLSDYFRYSLSCRDEVFVRLGDEFDAIMSYLTVEKARFHDSLVVDCHLDPELRTMAVPGIFLQPLVENALKYGHMTSSTPLRLTLRVSAAPENGAIVEVSNSGRWIEPPSPRPEQDPGGNGLSILRRRLELLYPGRHSLEIHPSVVDEEVTVRIRLPFTTHPPDSHAPSNPRGHR